MLHLARNSGKGEAVRQGLLSALASDTELVGYWDADLSTPLDELPRFMKLLEERPTLHMVLGARVALLGRIIERYHIRHFTGRVFATAASIVLGLPVYDTQCGAKLFRASSELSAVLSSPFSNPWSFDVELLAIK